MSVQRFDDFDRMVASDDGQYVFFEDYQEATSKLNEAVAGQVIELRALRKLVRSLRSAIRRAKLHIVCVGGPLNDNVKRYSPDQLVTFQKILTVLEEVDTCDDSE